MVKRRINRNDLFVDGYQKLVLWASCFSAVLIRYDAAGGKSDLASLFQTSALKISEFHFHLVLQYINVLCVFYWGFYSLLDLLRPSPEDEKRQTVMKFIHFYQI